MILTRLITLVFMLSFLTTCGIKEQIKQRQLLKKVKISLVKSTPAINFDANLVTVGEKSVILQDIKLDNLSLLKDLRQGKFSLKLNEIKLNNTFQINNPNNKSVVLDQFTFDVFFGEQKITTVTNNHMIKVAANSRRDFLITTAISYHLNISKLLDVKHIRIKGTLTLSLVFLGKTFYFDVDINEKKPIPHQAIKQFINKAKQKVINDIGEKIKNISVQQLEKLQLSF